ncbi:unnamed protein product [Closterium sp. NIES-65]|nr:unnamed protein product [Closterium sp. NIES-65]
MATPSVLAFDAEGRAINFEVWVDDLQLFLQCDRADGLSLFHLTSGASPALAADADATVHSQWATHDAAARLAVRRHLPTTKRAHFSQYKSAQTFRSVRRLPLAGDAALARARGARARLELVGVVEVAVEAAEGVGVAVGVVAGVEVSVAAAEAEAAEAVAVGAEAAVVAEVEAAVAEEVELVGVVLRSGAAPVVRQRGGVFGPCTYVLHSGDRGGEQCGGAHPTQGCFGRLMDAWRQQFPEAGEIPRWGELSRAGVAIYDLDFDAILAAMYAVTISDEGDCYRCFPPNPGIGTAALGASEATALGASASAPSGTGEAALSGTASASASLTFTLDSGASRSFFRDCTTLTPLGRPVAVSLADPSGGPVLSHFSTVLSCPAAPSGTLSGLYLPSFSTNLVSGADLQDAGVHLFTPARPRPSCVPCVEGRLRAAPHSSQFPPTEAPLQTLHMDVWGPARVRGQGHERYFLLVVDDYSRYTTVFPLRSKGNVTEVLIDWIRAARLQLRRSFGSDFPVLRLHYDRGREFSSGLLRAYFRARGIRQTFKLSNSTQQNGIAEHRIGMVMDVARTSMMHAAAPHFLWPFAVRYAAHQINLHPRVSRPETSPSLLWTRKVGDASVFRVWGSRAFVRDLSADKLSPRAALCVFLGFPLDAPGWQFYHPTSHRVLSSQDVTFDELVPYYHLFPYRTPFLPPPPHFLVTGPPPVDPLPPQGPAPSGVSQVDAVEPVEVAGDSGTAAGAEPGGAKSGGGATGGAEPGGATTGGAEPGGTATGGAEPGGATTGDAEPGSPLPGGATSRAAPPEGAEPAAAGPARVASSGAGPGGSPGSSLREPISPQELREWFARAGGVLLELELIRSLWVLVPLVPEVLFRLELELLRVLVLRLLLSVLTAVPLWVLLELLEVLQLEVLLALVLPLRVRVLSLLCLESPRGLDRTSFRSFSRFLVFLLL